MDFSGVYPALTTPFAADGSVSIEGIKHNITRYNSTGLTGFVAMGSTGESVLLSHSEWEKCAGGGERGGGAGNATDRRHRGGVDRGDDRENEAGGAARATKRRWSRRRITTSLSTSRTF